KSQDSFATDHVAAFLDAVAEGVTVQDTTGRLVYANDIAARVMGFASAADLLGTPVPDLLTRFRMFGEDGSPFPLEHLLGRMVLSGQQARPAVLRYVNVQTGEQRWALLKARPVLDAHGQLKYAVNT